MDFHLDRVSKDKTPITVFSWTQKNNSKITQNLSVTKEKTVTTEDSYEFTWDEGTKMTCEILPNKINEMCLGYIHTVDITKCFCFGFSNNVLIINFFGILIEAKAIRFDY